MSSTPFRQVRYLRVEILQFRTKFKTVMASCWRFTRILVTSGGFQSFSRRFLSQEISPFRSSRPEVFCKKGVLRNFTKFTRKPLCQSLFFNKVTGLRSATLLNNRLWHRCFPVNFPKNTYFHRTPPVAASDHYVQYVKKYCQKLL